MNIELPVGDSQVSIALHRNYHISNKVPVTVEKHGKIVRQLIEDTQVIKCLLPFEKSMPLSLACYNVHGVHTCI